MTTKFIKLLTASSAFVAASGAVHAATIETSQNTPLANTNATNYISGSAVVSSTGLGPAITISGTGLNDLGSASVGISTSAIVRSDAVTGTISLGNGAAISGTLTINNSGTIINTNAAGSAISLTTSANSSPSAVIINNTGTISGTVNVGSAGATNSAFTYNGTGATQRGDILSVNTTGTDTVNLTNSTMTGLISLSGGVNNVTVSNSTLTGGITGGTGTDTVTIQGGSTVTGLVDVGAGNNAVTINGSTVRVTSGNAIAAGNGNDVLTLVNATVSGSIDLSTGTNAVYVSGTQAFTTHGAITGAGILGVSGTTANINHSIGTAAVSTAANGTVNFNDTQTLTGAALTNAGTMNFTSGTVTAATYTASAGANTGFTITSNTNAGNSGKLVLTGGGADLSGGSLTIAFGNVGFLASGTTFTLVDGTATSQLAGTTIASATGVYRLSTQRINANQDIQLVVGRVSTSTVVEGETAKSIANVLDVLGAGAVSTSSLYTVQSLIGQQATAAGVDNIVQSLAPAIDGAGAASVAVTQATGNQVSNRLASLRGTSGVATGDPMATQHVWLQGFGSRIDQDNNKGAYGYKATSGGASLGADSDIMLDGYTTGVAFSYGAGSVDSKSSNNGNTDISSYIGTLYGSKVFGEGNFVNAQVGLGYNDYDMKRTVIGAGTARGKTHGWQGTAKVEGGRDYGQGALILTPLASLQYTYLDIDSYTETGAGAASLRVKPKSMDALDAGIGGQAAYSIPLSNGGTFKPNAHAKYIYRLGDGQLATTSQFTGGGAAFTTKGVKADRSSVNLGAGVLLSTVGGTDLSLDYDADIRSNLVGHTGQLKARWAF